MKFFDTRIYFSLPMGVKFKDKMTPIINLVSSEGIEKFTVICLSLKKRVDFGSEGRYRVSQGE